MHRASRGEAGTEQKLHRMPTTVSMRAADHVAVPQEGAEVNEEPGKGQITFPFLGGTPSTPTNEP